MLIANHSYLLIKAASRSFLLGNQALVWNSISQNGVLEGDLGGRGGKCCILNGYMFALMSIQKSVTTHPLILQILPWTRLGKLNELI